MSDHTDAARRLIQKATGGPLTGMDDVRYRLECIRAALREGARHAETRRGPSNHMNSDYNAGIDGVIADLEFLADELEGKE